MTDTQTEKTGGYFGYYSCTICEKFVRADRYYKSRPDNIRNWCADCLISTIEFDPTDADKIIHDRIEEVKKRGGNVIGYKCKACNILYTLAGFNNHRAIPPNIKSFCSICRKRFNCEGLRVKHQKEEHGPDKSIYPCHKCKGKFTEKGFLPHVKSCTGVAIKEKDWPDYYKLRCSCGKIFDREALASHQLNLHPANIICSYCQVKFSDITIISHMDLCQKSSS